MLCCTCSDILSVRPTVNVYPQIKEAILYVICHLLFGGFGSCDVTG